MNFLKKNGAGLLLCLVIAVPSWFLGQAVPVVGGPVFAILTGMIVTLILANKEPFLGGINFTSKKILQAAVVFLGFGMNLTEILAKGRQSLPIIISTIATSLIIAFLLYKALKLKTNNAILVGVGSSICGGSAIAATAPVNCCRYIFHGGRPVSALFQSEEILPVFCPLLRAGIRGDYRVLSARRSYRASEGLK